MLLFCYLWCGKGQTFLSRGLCGNCGNWKFRTVTIIDFSCSASESLELLLYANSRCGTFVFQRLYDDIDVSCHAVMMKYARCVLSSSPGHVTDETLLSHLHVRTGCSTFPRSRGNKQHVTTATSTDFLILCILQLWLLTDTSDGLILIEIISSSLMKNDSDSYAKLSIFSNLKSFESEC